MVYYPIGQTCTKLQKFLHDAKSIYVHSVKLVTMCGVYSPYIVIPLMISPVCWNRKVFRFFLKVFIDSSFLNSCGSWFQSLGAVYLKARLPYLVLQYVCFSILVSRFEISSRLLRKLGLVLLKCLYTIRSILYMHLCSTRSQ